MAADGRTRVVFFFLLLDWGIAFLRSEWDHDHDLPQDNSRREDDNATKTPKKERILLAAIFIHNNEYINYWFINFYNY